MDSGAENRSQTGSIEADMAVNFGARLRSELLAQNAISEVDFARARRVFAEQVGEESLVSLLLRLGMVSERVMAEALAEITGLPLVRSPNYPDSPILQDKISPRFLKDQSALPLEEEGNCLRVAVVDPTNDYLRRALSMATDLDIQFSVGVGAEIQQALAGLYFENKDRSREGLDESAPVSEEDVAQLRDMASEAPVIRLVNQLIQRAVESRASDIHVEPFENLLKIRYRIDGVLRDEFSPSKQMSAAIISRIKIMANLDIAERRLPQDGRITQRVHGEDMDIRVSTVPTMYGESVVMRLLRRESVALEFDSLGFSGELKRRFKKALDMPYGMIIVTGPTGSGKSTTLYTALNSLNSAERKIITVEDPVEYNLEGINQIQVNPSIGLTFSGCLRSIVRQDPDVIMVGEMRDLETARICVQSALTGHLVLSTLHTNDTASSVTRLMDMGVEEYLINSTLNMVLAQRLVRVLCPDCKREVEASDSHMQGIDLRKLQPEGPLRLFEAVGCEACGGTGYRGRTCIIEMMEVTERLRGLILQRSGAGMIEKAAREEGMHTMFEDGCLKALAGITTLDEVIRVSQEN